jgi:hypothetical protein
MEFCREQSSRVNSVHDSKTPKLKNGRDAVAPPGPAGRRLRRFLKFLLRKNFLPGNGMDAIPRQRKG